MKKMKNLKKWNPLALLALLVLLTVPAQASWSCPATSAAPRWNVVRRWAPWTCPTLPACPGWYVPGDADAPENSTPVTIPDAPAPVDEQTPAVPTAPVEQTPTVPTTPAEQTPTVPTTPAAPTQSVAGLSEYEMEVVRLVNEVRARYGLSALEADAELSRVARYKSQDMRDKGYFAHESPTYGTPFQMMKSFGISYRTAGENIAYGYRTPQLVMDGWMNSDGHRANILNASYTRIGVGYVADGNYWTQMFTG